MVSFSGLCRSYLKVILKLLHLRWVSADSWLYCASIVMKPVCARLMFYSIGFSSKEFLLWTSYQVAAQATCVFFLLLFFFYSKSRPFRRNSTIEQQCEQWAARIWKAALGNVAAGSIQLRRPEVSASTQERRAKYGGGGGREWREGRWVWEGGSNTKEQN